jgi:acetolactate synthase I/III small subunit
MKHILSVLVENRAGVLYKVVGMFSRRAFNIESLVVGVTQDPMVSRMTIVIDGDDNNIEQVTKQLHKLIDVIKVSDISKTAISREFAFVKIRSTPAMRNEIILLANILETKVIDISPETITLEVTGDEERLSNIKTLFEKYVILEMVQTGIVSIEKGSYSLRV